MKPLNYFSLIILVAGFVFTSCGSKKKPTSDNPNDSTQVTDSPKVEIKVDQNLSAYARFIAGINASEGFTDTYLNDPDFEAYKKRIDKDWIELDSTKLRPITGWAKQNVPQGKSDALFYPFAGGDFLYANAYFPDVNHITMVGLEPAGHIHELDSLSTDKVFAYLSALHRSLFFSNKYGFFRTKSMKVEFGQKMVNGTIHPVLLHIARYGYDITHIKYCNLKEDGSLEYVDKEDDHFGYEVGYTDGEVQKTVHYFKFDLYDPSMKKNQSLLPFVQKDGDTYLLLKSASYLPQYSTYTIITEFMLKHSKVVVQDDSGIPYRMLNNDQWKVTLWGEHTRNLSLFHNYNQPDLKEAYKNQEKKNELPFEIGYNITHGETSIIVAERQVENVEVNLVKEDTKDPK